MTIKLPKRSELSPQETWDLSLLFEDQAAYEAAYQVLERQILDFQDRYQGRLDQVKTVLAALSDYDEIQAAADRVLGYGSLGYEVDKTNPDYEVNEVRATRLSELMGGRLAFFSIELSQLEAALWDEVYQAIDASYRPFLDEIQAQQPYLLSQDLEAALSGMQDSLFNQYALYGAMKFQDMQFDDFQVGGKTYENSFPSFEQYYEADADPAVRQAAWESFYEGLRRYQHTAANNYISHVQTEKKLASLRGFHSVIDYLLFNQRVDQRHYHQIIDTIMERLSPVMQRYAKMLGQHHGLDQVSLADIKTSYSQGAPTISIAESRRQIEDALALLGEDYLAIVRRAFDERWIDYPLNQTKSTGGFCSTHYDAPSYILLNWTGAMSEVLTLAHELGHAGHFQLANQYQRALTPEASLYFIEAPSTANEVIMMHHLLAQPLDAAAKVNLITEFIGKTYYHNMVTHLLEAHFQRKVYQAVDREEVLNADRLNQFFRESLEAFWGDAVVISPGAELTWMRQPHYFMGLYSYTYSAGLTIGTHMGRAIAGGDSEAVTRWLDVLKAGGSQSAKELAAHAGVDIDSTAALVEAIDYIDQLLDQVESLQ